MNQVYSQLDATQTELEQEKTRNKELTNQRYHLQEELEKAHEALHTTRNLSIMSLRWKRG